MAISKEFGSSARNTALAGLLTLSLLSPFNALAQEQGSVAAPPSTRQSDAQMSRLEALRASAGGAVLYYGDGIEGAEADARVLDTLLPDYKVRAIPGAKGSEVQLFINRKIIASYSQRDLDRGSVGADAMTYIQRNLDPNVRIIRQHEGATDYLFK